jgi:hypothetical protein
VTAVASLILLADIGDQRLRTLHLNFEGCDQRVFRVNDNVFRFPLKFKANRKLHLCTLPISVKTAPVCSPDFSERLTKLLAATPAKELEIDQNQCRRLRDWTLSPSHAARARLKYKVKNR